MTSPSQVHMVALKLWHATSGLYIWEFFTTLDYEWAVIRGRLPYRWTILVYSVARVAALLGVISCIVIMDVTAPINCQLWTTLSVFLFCLSAFTSSLLIIFRTIAIWNRNKAVMAVAITIFSANIGFHLQNVIRIRSVWVPAQLACGTETDPSLLAFIPAITSDMILLLFVLVGLLVMRRRGDATFGLTRVLWQQGIMWLILGAVADIPPLVLTFLHFNDPLHALFETPGVIIMTIATTRMHRSLVNFASSDVVDSRLSGLAFARTRQTDAVSTAPDRVELDMAFGQHPKGSSNGGDSYTIFSTGEKMPHIVGDSSKLSLAPESKQPLPAVSSSLSISEAQSV